MLGFILGQWQVVFTRNPIPTPRTVLVAFDAAHLVVEADVHSSPYPFPDVDAFVRQTRHIHRLGQPARSARVAHGQLTRLSLSESPDNLIRLALRNEADPPGCHPDLTHIELAQTESQFARSGAAVIESMVIGRSIRYAWPARSRSGGGAESPGRRTRAVSVPVSGRASWTRGRRPGTPWSRHQAPAFLRSPPTCAARNGARASPSSCRHS